MNRTRTVLTFMATRIATTIAILVAVTAVVFFGGRTLAPGDITTVLVGSEGASPEEIERLRELYNVDGSLIGQYFDWLMGILQGDFGRSFVAREAVADVLARQAPVSFSLATVSLIIACAIGIPVGIYAAANAGKQSEWIVRLPFLIAFGVPVFVAGALLLILSARYFPSLYSVIYVPMEDGLLPHLQSIALPALSAGLPTSAVVMQMTRGAMLDSLSSTYADMAKAKGLTRNKIVMKHGLRGALSPIVTLLGFQFGILLSSLFVVEELFSLPGLGRGLIQSIGVRDFGLVQAQTLVVAAGYILGNFIVDVVQPLLDPRVVGNDS